MTESEYTQKLRRKIEVNQEKETEVGDTPDASRRARQ